MPSGDPSREPLLRTSSRQRNNPIWDAERPDLRYQLLRGARNPWHNQYGHNRVQFDALLERVIELIAQLLADAQ